MISPAYDWPSWFTFSVYQAFVDVNVSAEYNQGVIQYLPSLVANWTESSNGETWTFQLRQGVNFSNGDPFNSYEFWADMYGLYYIFGNSSSWLGRPIINMNNVTFGPASLALLNQSGLNNPTAAAIAMMSNSSWPIYVTGPYTIMFQLSSPYAWFPGLFVGTGDTGYAVDMGYAITHGGGLGTPASPNPYWITNPIPGTGPYVITDVSTNAYVELAQNPSYWGKNLSQSEIKANPYLNPGQAKQVIFNYVPDDTARYTDVATGASDFSIITYPDFNLILDNPSQYSYLRLPISDDFQAIGLNTLLYPTNNTDFRQAIVHAINYSQIIQEAYYGEASTFMGPEYITSKAYYDLGNFAPYQYNMTLAEQYLNESGVTNPPPIVFNVVSVCQECLTTAEIVQSDLAALNITVSIQVMTIDTFNNYWSTYSFDVANVNTQQGNLNYIGGEWWQPSYVDPVDGWFWFVSNESLFGNQANYYNPIVQNCLNEFLSDSTNTTAVTIACTAAQKQIYDDAPYIWILWNLWFGDGSWVYKTSGPINSFYMDPDFGGNTFAPVVNTVTFK